VTSPDVTFLPSQYAAVARDPGRDYHFHTGRPLASRLGYHDDWLEGLPEDSIASFGGTGNPFRIGQLRPGERVVDIGSGAGLDSLIARGHERPGVLCAGRHRSASV